MSARTKRIKDSVYSQLVGWGCGSELPVWFDALITAFDDELTQVEEEMIRRMRRRDRALANGVRS